MELYTTVDNVIIQNKEKHQSLWCNRLDGKLIPVQGCILPESWDPVCRGLVYGIIGRMQLLPGDEWKLLVISERDFVGYLPIGIEVYRITKIGVVSLSNDEVDVTDLNLQACESHKTSENEQDSETSAQQKVQKTWNTIKSSANQFTEKTNHFLKDDDGEKIEKKLFEEMVKMFESGSFYYSPNGDLSNTRQRASYFKHKYNWKQTDDRFFWNKHMLADLVSLGDESASHWILPIMQGFIQIERCTLDFMDYLNVSGETDSLDGCSDDEDIVDSEHTTRTTRYHSGENLKEDEYDVILISRRGRHRAGTRYKRRGVDDDGHVANYVETEQIVCVLTHTISHVQVRGSVPVFWSQPGVKYKPLPVIDRSFAESKDAFAKHFNEELSIYDNQVLISLVELSGREKPIADAYLDHIFEYNSENLTYITFDFHEYCRGMKFENVAVLTNVVDHLMDQMGYFWTDPSGVIMEQSSVFRINCMDCLDRTNVVQAAIARSVISSLLRRLGRLLPEEMLPKSCRRMHNVVWANNGDAISRQYAGTAAMKGDFTRTGERKIAGLVKDGYNSASRYYLNRFKDMYRQTVIDMMLGNGVNEPIEELVVPTRNHVDEEWTYDKEESIAQLVRHTEVSLLPQNEECRGGWALVDPFTFCADLNEHADDEDVVLLLTREAYYVARYSDVIEEIYSYQRMPIECLEKIEIGMECAPKNQQYLFMRIYHRYNKMSGYFHSFKTIQQRSHEESRGILLSVAETFVTLCRNQGLSLKITEVKQLDRNRTKPHQSMKTISSKRTLRTSSKCDDLGVRRTEVGVVGDTKRQSLKPSLSLTDLTEISAADDEDNEFLRLHKQHSPRLKQEGTKRKENELFPHVGLRSGMASSSSCGVINELGSSEQEKSQSSSKLDSLFKKTKTAISNVTPKMRNIPNLVREGDGKAKSRDGVFNFSITPMKNTLQKMNDKILNHSSTEFKNPLKMFPNIRSKLQTVLTVPKPKVRILTEEEKEKRMHCKTKIIEL